MKEKKNGPQKGAAKKWSERLKQLGQQTPPEDLLKILNKNLLYQLRNWISDGNTQGMDGKVSVHNTQDRCL